jgi:hypothetical protein
MRFAIVVLGLVVFVSTVDAQRIYTQAAKIDSGSVYLKTQEQTYHSHTDLRVGYHSGSLHANFRTYFVFDASALPEINLVTRVWMEYGSGQTYAGDTVRAFILPNWQKANLEEAYNGIGEGIQVDAYATPYSSNIVRSYDISSTEALNALYSGDSIAFGFILEPTPDHYITIVSVRLHIEYCGGATATLTVDNVIEAGIEYAGSNSLVRMGAGEFLEPPLARETLLGADIACEVWNARYDSTTTGTKMKPFLWQMYVDALPPTYTVLNYDTSSMASEYTSYARAIIPASISTVDEFDGGLNVEVFFKDPWRITQEDSVQTREGDYLPHVTPYASDVPCRDCHGDTYRPSARCQRSSRCNHGDHRMTSSSARDPAAGRAVCFGRAMPRLPRGHVPAKRPMPAEQPLQSWRPSNDILIRTRPRRRARRMLRTCHAATATGPRTGQAPDASGAAAAIMATIE